MQQHMAGESARYRWSAVEQAATGAQHNQIISGCKHLRAGLMHNSYNCKAACCKLFEKLKQRQGAAAVEPAGGLI